MKTIIAMFIIMGILTFTPNVEAKADKFKISARCAQWAYILDRDKAAKLHFKVAYSGHDVEEINFQAGYALGIVKGAQIFSSKHMEELSLILYKNSKCISLLPI